LPPKSSRAAGRAVGVLVVNAGSASLKLRLVGADEAVVAAEELPATHGRADPDEARAAIGRLSRLGAVDAVGHRIVHGGTTFTQPVLIDADVERELAALAGLAPLHQPAALTALADVAAAVPDVPQVACFDTAFHARIPAAAATYPVPAQWRERYGIRRYGFHGLSHAYASGRAAELTGGSRIVTCHLGSGASLAAVRDGVGVDTTMGFTPLEGLVMSTRSGTLDPGLVLWLQTSAGMSAETLTDALFHSSGLTALAGTGDMKAVVEGAAAGAEAATLALAVYQHRLRAAVAAMTAALGGLDTLVFTGGVGERSAAVRAGAADGLTFLGVAVDPGRNAAHAGGDSDITAAGAAVRTLVLEAREDLEIARGVRACLASPAAAP
jgi:acetate kinase